MKIWLEKVFITNLTRQLKNWKTQVECIKFLFGAWISKTSLLLSVSLKNELEEGMLQCTVLPIVYSKCITGHFKWPFEDHWRD